MVATSTEPTPEESRLNSYEINFKTATATPKFSVKLPNSTLTRSRDPKGRHAAPVTNDVLPIGTDAGGTDISGVRALFVDGIGVTVLTYS